MRVLTAEQTRAFDEWAIGTVGVPSLVLMENASRAVVDEVLRLRKDGEVDPSRSVLVLCGPGNNGGDGVAVARLLASEGIESACHLIGEPKEGGDLAKQIAIARTLGHALTDGPPGGSSLDQAGLIVDALFGTGLSRPLEGAHADLVRAVNASPGVVLAVDLPSGLDASRGALVGPAVRAARTVTFPLPKIAHHLHPAADHCGRVVVRSLGVEPPRLAGPRIDAVLAERVATELPTRPAAAHKGTFGRVLVVAGSEGLEGAAVLAASAAVAGGAGLVRLLVPGGIRARLNVRPEVMVRGAGGVERGCFGPEDLELVADQARGQDALILGPGLGRDAKTRDFVEGLLARWTGPSVIDADALDGIGGGDDRQGGGDAPSPRWALTPHPGELARLLERTTDEIVAQPLESAVEAARRWNSILVLKGRATVIAEPDGRSWINTTGGPLLASGGSGDVLAGLIGALSAAGLGMARSARCGVFFHGLAADRLSASRARLGLGASAICDGIPLALEEGYRVQEAQARRSVTRPFG